jgi:predicted GH43/DUF377 family glycosyl hydrolase
MNSLKKLSVYIKEDTKAQKNALLKEKTITETEDLPNFEHKLPDEGMLVFTADSRNLTYINEKDLIDPETNVYYYNSSICKYNNFYRLFYRCGKNPKTCEDRIATCLLTKELKVIPETNKYIDAYTNWQTSRNSGPDTLERHIRYSYAHKNDIKSFMFKDNHHVEDPRAIEFQGNWFVFYTDGLTIGVAKLDLETCDIIYSHYLQVPPNDILSSESDGREKNWIPVVSNNKLYLLYSDNPRTFIHCVDEGNRLNVINYDKLNFSVTWSYGKVRGGCPPVEYDEDTLIWFFHSSTQWYSTMYMIGSRIYFIGAYLTTKKYPFEIKKISKFPVFFGPPSHVSEKSVHQTNVAFPCGAVTENDEFIISMGINDHYIAHLKVSKNDIIWKPFQKKFLYLKLETYHA